MKNKNGILIILTPFHLHQYLIVMKQYGLPNSSLIIFHLNTISRESIKRKLGSDLSFYLIPNGEISYSKFIKNPISTYKHLYALFKNYEKSIENISSLIQYKLDLYIGSDKDLFTQILVQKLKTQFITIHAFDEGSSFYIDTSVVDRMKGVLFNLSSKFLWGYNFKYIRTMGSSNWINIIYARMPSLIKNKRAKTLKISNKKGTPNTKCQSDKILFISSPLSEYNLIKKDIELKKYNQIISFFSKSQDVEIKLHPKESINKFNSTINGNANVSIVGKNNIAENINFFNYNKIINFGSSVVIDILSINYPPKDILTFHITNRMKLPGFYSITALIKFIKTDNFEEISTVLEK